jgi:hypothetical protein
MPIGGTKKFVPEHFIPCTSKQNQFSIIFVTDSKFVASSGKFCAALRPALW